MRQYKCLAKSVFGDGNFTLVPIRDKDKFAIMDIRNEQLYHLRQPKPLTAEDQENYFANTIAELFKQEKPDQILFSLLKNEEFIGYGGLVHINWIDKNAEISFVVKTALEQEHFEVLWINYLILLEKAAFAGLHLHKIYTFAFDLRPHLYQALEKSGFHHEATLKEHCLFEGKFIDVVIHSKLNDAD